MDSFMGSFDFYEADEITIPNDNAAVHEQNPSATSEGLHRHQLAEPGRITAGPNRHPVGTGRGGHALNDGLKIGKEHQYQSTSALEVGTKTPRVNETGSSYGVIVAPAPMVQQVPIEQYYMPVLSECLDSPNAADQTKLKRKAFEVARDPERKRKIDEAYRRRCKDKKMKTEAELAAFTEENKGLKTENSQLKEEEVRLQGIVQQLQRGLDQVKGQLDRQNTVVDLLSKLLAKPKYVNVQRENEQLKHENALLINQINNPNTMDIIQLQAKIERLENIIDVLCKKDN